MQKLFPILAGVVLGLALATAAHADTLQSSVDVRAAASHPADLVVAGADAALRNGLVKTSTAANSRSRPGDPPPNRTAGVPADAEAAVAEDPADLDLLALFAGFVLVVVIAVRRSNS
ncbi:hypothetical protein os1_10640 [Comamonadaceae bacterium OS-1]|nr:hypothetical protein os1_10640 [Comamonadaceae bacterium OS-1]